MLELQEKFILCKGNQELQFQKQTKIHFETTNLLSNSSSISEDKYFQWGGTQYLMKQTMQILYG